jgi:hypothetical protein
VHAKELPMLKSEVPVPDVTEAKASAKGATEASAKSATVASAKGAPDTAKGAQATAKAQPIPMPAPRGEAEDADQIETGSVEE